jgi:cell wall-associated NlpC family hydrolase
MVARLALVLAAAATLIAGCGTSRAQSRYRTLPPPAGESRAGARDDRGVGPAPASVQGRRAPPPAERLEVSRAVETAASLVGRREIVVAGRDYGDGCAALVRAAFDRAGHPLPPTAQDAASLYALALSRGLLRPGIRSAAGDVVFLSDRPGGPPAHVGLVARVEPDGTALVLHRVARGVRRLRVNLGYPARVADPATGKRLNDTLVVGSAAQPAGSLVVAIATLL